MKMNHHPPPIQVSSSTLQVPCRYCGGFCHWRRCELANVDTFYLNLHSYDAGILLFIKVSNTGELIHSSVRANKSARFTVRLRFNLFSSELIRIRSNRNFQERIGTSKGEDKQGLVREVPISMEIMRNVV